MGRRAVFLPYRPRTILNQRTRPEHWFWTRYSAYPYLGCQHGCQFCYCRERKYAQDIAAADFAYTIRYKENAPELLRRSLRRLPPDLICVGDYQPVERRLGLSRRMLEVCRDLGFPVLLLERSPLLVRDLDLLQEIHSQSRAVVILSLLTAPGSPQYAAIRQVENLAPAPEKRLAAMQTLAAAGIPVGVSFMPVLPGLCEDEANIAAVVRAVCEHGGSFLLSGGLTLADDQRTYFLEFLERCFPSLIHEYARLYPPGSYGPRSADWLPVARRIRAICAQAGLPDRMPRPLRPGEKRWLNRRIVEILARRLYDLELDEAPQSQQWAYRRAAWALEDLEVELGLFYRTLGRNGLEKLPGMSPALAGEVVTLIDACRQVEAF